MDDIPGELHLFKDAGADGIPGSGEFRYAEGARRLRCSASFFVERGDADSWRKERSPAGSQVYGRLAKLGNRAAAVRPALEPADQHSLRQGRGAECRLE